MPSRSALRDRDRGRRCLPARPMRSAAAAQQSSSTPITACRRLHARDQPLLDRGVMLDRAVAVEMIRADVDQDADASDRAWARDRSGRTSTRSHGRGPALGGFSVRTRCRYCRRAARRRPAAASRCAISAVVVDLPLVPVMATNGACGASLRRSRQNSSTSPMISTPALARQLHRPVRLGWVSGTPGASSSAANLRPVELAQVGGGDAGRARLRRRCFGVVVEGDDLGAAGDQRLRARQPRAAEAEHARPFFAGESW